MIILKKLGVILLVILLLIVLLLALILFVPFTYVFEGNSNDRRIQLSGAWLFGSVKMQFIKYFSEVEDKLELTIFGFTKKLNLQISTESAGEAANEPTGKRREKKRKDKNRKYSWITHINKSVLNEVKILIKRVWLRIKPDVINVDISAGFDDPMYTGILYGFYCQFLCLINEDKVRFRPVFNEKILEGSFYLRGRIKTFYILLVFLRFLVSPPIRKEIKFRRNMKGGVEYAR